MPNTIVSETLTSSYFLNSAPPGNGESITGTWTDTFDSSGILLGISNVSITAVEGTYSSSYTGGYVSLSGAGSPTNYEIVLTPSGGPADGISVDLFWTDGVETPTSLASPSYNIFTNTSGAYTYNLTSSTVISNVLCFAGGTQISTPQGEVAVETLRAGDLVLTATGEAKPVRWLGISDVAGRFADEVTAAPIRIKAGALGENLPGRDLRLSPAHAVYLDGILVQAGALVNGVTILRETMPEHFRYYHIELDTHELLLSEGIASESFVDNVERRHFSNADERTGQALPIQEMDLPRAKSHRQVPDALRLRLAARVASFLAQNSDVA